MQQPPNHRLAELNIGRIGYYLDDPRMAEFTGNLLEHLKQHGPSDHAFDWQRASAQLWKTARYAPPGQVA